MVFSSLVLAGALCASGAASGADISELRSLGTSPERLRLAAALEKGLKAYDAVRDYKAVFRKQEKSGDALGPQETIFFKFEKPFKIFMGWMNTHKKGLQVLYERGKHDGKLAIHKPGLLLGLAPVIFLEQSSPWVREGSASYNIEDAGIGTFLNDFAEAVLKAAREDKLKVELLDRPGDELYVTFLDSKEGSGYFAYRVSVYFDPATGLPVHMSLFDWNDQPMGVYSYEKLRLNVGAEDPEFKDLAERKLYRLFAPPVRQVSSNNFSGKSPRAIPTAG
jgi:hypothetical protein